MSAGVPPYQLATLKSLTQISAICSMQVFVKTFMTACACTRMHTPLIVHVLFTTWKDYGACNTQNQKSKYAKDVKNIILLTNSYTCIYKYTPVTQSISEVHM